MPRHRGPLYQLTDEWRVRVLAALKAQGLTKGALARVLKVHPSAITRLLRMTTDKPPGGPTSSIAKPVADYLGVRLEASARDPGAKLESFVMGLYRKSQLAPDKLVELQDGLARLKAQLDELGERTKEMAAIVRALVRERDSGS